MGPAIAHHIHQWNFRSLISRAPDYDAWRYLRMTYQSDWPLHLILHTDAMIAYNAMFDLLFSLRRASHNLQEW